MKLSTVCQYHGRHTQAISVLVTNKKAVTGYGTALLFRITVLQGGHPILDEGD